MKSKLLILFSVFMILSLMLGGAAASAASLRQSEDIILRTGPRSPVGAGNGFDGMKRPACPGRACAGDAYRRPGLTFSTPRPSAWPTRPFSTTPSILPIPMGWPRMARTCGSPIRIKTGGQVQFQRGVPEPDDWQSRFPKFRRCASGMGAGYWDR